MDTDTIGINLTWAAGKLIKEHCRHSVFSFASSSLEAGEQPW